MFLQHMKGKTLKGKECEDGQEQGRAMSNSEV